ncbi:hypothetical protein MNBD_GAMMA06-1195 [hydrothermal vent metagenome]|uniref:Toxin YafO n=1 Tax=hydrothermal vent metagenome TaxID=652676 RepID=A0A3B0W696_9ZZZZ
MIEIFKTELIRKQATPTELEQLEKDFARYKETGIPADCFGRDVLYNHVNSLPSVLSAELKHIHLLPSAHKSVNTTRQFNKTSDNHLVYCNGYYSNEAYLLIAILAPDAHAQSRKNNVMFKLAQIAENFRENN